MRAVSGRISVWRSVPINRISTIHYDIDGNGTKELIIADGENGGSNPVFNP